MCIMKTGVQKTKYYVDDKIQRVFKLLTPYSERESKVTNKQPRVRRRTLIMKSVHDRIS